MDPHTNPWDQRFGGEEYVYGREPNDFLREMAPRIPPGPVLCLAEGEGRNAVFLAGLGYAVTSVDGSGEGVRKTLRLAKEHGVAVEALHADLADFRIEPGGWAGIVSIFAHLPPPLRREVHRQVVDGLRPGGVFVLEAYTPAQLPLGTGGPPVAELMMTLDGLRDELDGLELDVARELERDIREGRLHRGRSAVVQLVGRAPGDSGG
jgi:SAM-dependent methyltransferase